MIHCLKHYTSFSKPARYFHRSMGSYQPVSRIAIVGGGPTGVAFAKYLLAEKCFQKIDIFEQRDRVGGIWNLSSSEGTRQIPIPQLDPRYGSKQSTKHLFNGFKHHEDANGTSDRDIEFESPLYDYLETNIPKQIMAYSDHQFPEHYPLYPSHQEVLEYLDVYADEVRHLIRFGVQVEDISLVDNADSSRDRWQVTSKKLADRQMTTDIYDAVVVANGHYTVPSVPPIKGIAEWDHAYPGTIMHSKAYRKPEEFKDQTVLVIGNSASGIDIAGQIGHHSTKIYLSSRSESAFGTSETKGRVDISEVVEFLSPDKHTRSVKTRDAKTFENIDSVVFATGYFYNFPFLSNIDPPISSDGLRARDVYRDFVHIDHPHLALPLLNMRIIPFPLAENQAAVVARLWSGRLELPPKEEMRSWEQDQIVRKGEGKHFHLLKFPEDATQMNELYRWAASARPVPGLANDGQGKLGMRWDEFLVWLRSQQANLKIAYSARGNDRRKMKNLEELGFVFSDWRAKASDEELEMFRQAKCEGYIK